MKPCVIQHNGGRGYDMFVRDILKIVALQTFSLRNLGGHVGFLRSFVLKRVSKLLCFSHVHSQRSTLICSVLFFINSRP